ncbi:MAG: 50S ribosomal protein L23 [Bacilli bacterium]|nr:50S ribosomal protein L23 [Bacilli bacterium]
MAEEKKTEVVAEEKAKKVSKAKKPAAKTAAKKATAKKTTAKKATVAKEKTATDETKKATVKKAPATKTAVKATTKKVSATTKKVVKPEAEVVSTKKDEKKKLEIVEYRTRKATVRDFEILFGPYVTEKTQAQQADLNTIVLKVAKDATATEIKLAVQAVFGVKVKRVNIVNVRPKTKRSTRYPGTVPGFKKAIVKVDKQYDLGEIAKASQAD